jgi:hypothetical protein
MTMWERLDSCGDSRLGCPAKRSEASLCDRLPSPQAAFWVAQRFNAATKPSLLYRLQSLLKNCSFDFVLKGRGF